MKHLQFVWYRPWKMGGSTCWRSHVLCFRSEDGPIWLAHVFCLGRLTTSKLTRSFQNKHFANKDVPWSKFQFASVVNWFPINFKVSCRPQPSVFCPGESRGLLDAFAQHITRLLTGQRYTVIDDPERRGAIRPASTVMGGDDMTCAWLQPTDFGLSLNACEMILLNNRCIKINLFETPPCRILRSTFEKIWPQISPANNEYERI